MYMSRVKKLKPGPESILTDDVIFKIKDGVLEGKNYRDIATDIGVTENTIYTWRSKNYQGIVDKMNTWEAMYQLKEADAFSKRLMKMSTVDENGKIDARMVAIQQKESEFLREKLLIARDKYNSNQAVNINVVLPQPIIDLGKVVSTVEKTKELDK